MSSLFSSFTKYSYYFLSAPFFHASTIAVHSASHSMFYVFYSCIAFFVAVFYFMIFFLLQLAIKFASCGTINARRHRHHEKPTRETTRREKKSSLFLSGSWLEIRRKPEDGISYVNISNLCLYYYHSVYSSLRNRHPNGKNWWNIKMKSTSIRWNTLNRIRRCDLFIQRIHAIKVLENLFASHLTCRIFFSLHFNLDCADVWQNGK